ncbi:MAG TPA: ABC transporter ATP-binding protein [Bacteroidia bacterium]|nr:ABC transporter ATP-binding protein [Bacteroidia bacterium]HNT80814.1 ABC transporter ATP-binding protein [Bacteroidia bacterium]
MIEILSLHKRFKKLEVLRGVDLKLQSGKIYSILGPNGCGKSTLIKCILGMVIPDAGDIRINGETAVGRTKFKSRVGYMPQKAKFPSNVSVNEVLSMIKKIRNSKENVQELISLFEVEEHLKKKIATLSGGTLQKVSAIIALSYFPEIIILDEPTAGLDPSTRLVFKEYIKGLSKEGKTILLSSHVLSDVEELSDEIIILLNGMSDIKGSAEDLKKEMESPTLEIALTKIYQKAKLDA